MFCGALFGCTAHIIIPPERYVLHVHAVKVNRKKKAQDRLLALSANYFYNIEVDRDETGKTKLTFKVRRTSIANPLFPRFFWAECITLHAVPVCVRVITQWAVPISSLTVLALIHSRDGIDLGPAVTLYYDAESARKMSVKIFARC